MVEPETNEEAVVITVKEATTSSGAALRQEKVPEKDKDNADHTAITDAEDHPATDDDTTANYSCNLILRIRASVTRHPILTYLGITLIWSYVIWSLLFLFIQPGGFAIASSSHPIPPVTIGIAIVGGIGPSLGGITTTWLVNGRDGLFTVLCRQRCGMWRVGMWWCMAIFMIPAITALTPLVRWLAGYAQDGSDMVSRIGPGLALGIVAGLMEEFGWRGFLLPQLLQQFSPLKATLVLGLIWGLLWHGYADYFNLGGKGAATLVLILLLGPILLTAWSLLMTIVYLHTGGSLLLSIVMHASISSSALIFTQTYANMDEEMAWTAISVGIAVAISLLVWLGMNRCCSDYESRDVQASHHADKDCEEPSSGDSDTHPADDEFLQRNGSEAV